MGGAISGWLFGGVGQSGLSKAGEDVRKGLNEGASTVAESVRTLASQHSDALAKLGLNAKEAADALGVHHKEAAALVVDYGRDVVERADKFARELQLQLQGMTEQVTQKVEMLANAHKDINTTLASAVLAFRETADRALDQVDTALAEFSNSFRRATEQVNRSTIAFQESITKLAVYSVIAAHVQAAPGWVLVAAVICGFQALTTRQPFDDVVGDVFHRLISFAYSILLSFLCWMLLLAVVIVFIYWCHAYYNSLRIDMLSLQLQCDLAHKRIKLEVELKEKQRLIVRVLLDDSLSVRLKKLEERLLPPAPVPAPIPLHVPSSLFDGFSFLARSVTLNKDRNRIVFLAGSELLNLSVIQPTMTGSFLVPTGKGGAWLLMVSGKVLGVPSVVHPNGIKYEGWLTVSSSVTEDSTYSLGGGAIFQNDAGLPLLGHILRLHEGDRVSVELHSDCYTAPNITTLSYVLFQGEYRGALLPARAAR